MIVSRLYDIDDNLYMLEGYRIHEVYAKSAWGLFFKAAIIGIKELWNRI